MAVCSLLCMVVDKPRKLGLACGRPFPFGQEGFCNHIGQASLPPTGI
jgi:hypothetical protein